MMELTKGRRKTIKWSIFIIVMILIATISLWAILSRHTNQDKSYSGAKFVEYHLGGIPNAT